MSADVSVVLLLRARAKHTTSKEDGTVIPLTQLAPSTRTDRLLSRVKPEIWAKVDQKKQVSCWRAAEVMHRQLGESDMARRARVVPVGIDRDEVRRDKNIQRNGPPISGELRAVSPHRIPKRVLPPSAHALHLLTLDVYRMASLRGSDNSKSCSSRLMVATLSTPLRITTTGSHCNRDRANSRGAPPSRADRLLSPQLARSHPRRSPFPPTVRLPAT